MITEKNKKIIDNLMKEQNFDFKENEYENFMEYVQERLILKMNLKRLYSEFKNPVKKTLKNLNLTYKELSEQIGYTEAGLKNAVSKNKITLQLEKAVNLLVENYKLKMIILEKDKEIENYKKILKNTLTNKQDDDNV